MEIFHEEPGSFYRMAVCIILEEAVRAALLFLQFVALWRAFRFIPISLTVMGEGEEEKLLPLREAPQKYCKQERN